MSLSNRFLDFISGFCPRLEISGLGFKGDEIFIEINESCVYFEVICSASSCVLYNDIINVQYLDSK